MSSFKKYISDLLFRVILLPVHQTISLIVLTYLCDAIHLCEKCFIRS